MPTWLWRPIALAAIGLILVLIGGDLAHAGPPGDFGFEQRAVAARTGIVTAVGRDSPAARAHIAVGDRIDLAPGDLASRVSYFFGAPAPGAPVQLLVDHRGSARRVILRAASQSVPRDELLRIYRLVVAVESIRVVFVLVGALIVLRRPERDDARALASFLIAFPFAVFMRWPWLTVSQAALLYVTHTMAFWFALTQAIKFAIIFPHRSARGPRHAIERINRWVSAIGISYVGLAGTWTMLSDTAPNVPAPLRIALSTVVTSYCVVALSLGFVIGAREAIPADRERIKWIGISTAIGFGGLAIVLILQALRVPEMVAVPFVFLVVAIPIGTAYAILRHRMLDIGFVVSRALVFGIISAVVVAAFTLLEFLLGKYLTSLGHVQSAILEAGLALAIGVSLGRIHERVDSVVDTVFFRERHRCEAALRRLAREASYVDDPTVLGERIVSAVDRHAGASGAALYLHDGNGSFGRYRVTFADVPPTIARNDAAIVRMRASREAIDLDELSAEVERTALPGKIAFPMIVRGLLVGTLTCGAKRNHEEYAPDERATLTALANAAGIAFDTMQTDALRQAAARAVAQRDIAPLLGISPAVERPL